MTQKVAIEQKEQAREGGLKGQGFMNTLGGSLASKSVFDIATGSSCGKGEGQATWEYNWSASDSQSDESEEEDVTNKEDQGMDRLNPDEMEQDEVPGDSTNDVHMGEVQGDKMGGDVIRQNVWLAMSQQLAATKAREAALKHQLDELQALQMTSARGVQTGVQPAPPASDIRNDEDSRTQEERDNRAGGDEIGRAHV